MQMFAHGLKDLLMLFLIFIVFIIGLGLLLVGSVYTEVATGRQKKRFLFLDRYITKRGYRFINPEIHEWLQRLSVFEFAKKIISEPLKKGIDGLSAIREFQKGGHSGVEGFSLEIAGHEAVIFFHSYTGNAGGPGNSKPYTIDLRVAKMVRESGVSFRLENKTVSSRVLYGVNHLLQAAHKPIAPDYIELSAYPKFGKLYYLNASGDAELEKFFSAAKIRGLEEHPLQGVVVSEPSCLVYFEHGKFSDEATYDEFIGRAKKAYEILC